MFQITTKFPGSQILNKLFYVNCKVETFTNLAFSFQGFSFLKKTVLLSLRHRFSYPYATKRTVIRYAKILHDTNNKGPSILDVSMSWGEGCPHVPMVQRSQYIRKKNPFHKHFARMPMVGGQGSKIVKICQRLK